MTTNGHQHGYRCQSQSAMALQLFQQQHSPLEALLVEQMSALAQYLPVKDDHAALAMKELPRQDWLCSQSHHLLKVLPQHNWSLILETSYDYLRFAVRFS